MVHLELLIRLLPLVLITVMLLHQIIPHLAHGFKLNIIN